MNLKQLFFTGINYLRKLEFLFKEKSTELYDFILYSLQLNANALNYKEKSVGKRIVIAGLTPNHRVIKNLKWLKKKSDFELIMIYHKATPVTDLLPEYYNRKILFRNKTHLKRLFKGLKNIDLLYTYSSKPSYAKIAIAGSNIPSIFDPYDTYVVYYGKHTSLSWLAAELVDEEYCYKNATGLLARNTECWLAYKMFNISKTPNIFFSDYCDNEYFVNSNLKLNEIQNEIRMVYSGSIYGLHMKKSAHGFNDFSYLIENAEKQKIHFHIYPSPMTFKEVYYDYVETAAKLNYLHIQETIKQEELSKELSKYHFGVLPHFKDADSDINDAKLERGTSLKFYNFLEAGIPILVSNEMKFMAWVVQRYGIGIVFSKADIPNLREIILKHNYDELKRNVLTIREKFSMGNNTDRLVAFINKVASMK